MSHWHPAYPLIGACITIASPVLLAGAALYLAYVGVTEGAAYAKNNLFKPKAAEQKEAVELLELTVADTTAIKPTS